MPRPDPVVHVTASPCMRERKAGDALKAAAVAAAQQAIFTYNAGYDAGLERALLIVRAQLACTGRVNPEIPEWLRRTEGRLIEAREQGGVR